jgi:hypothetical protein
LTPLKKTLQDRYPGLPFLRHFLEDA